MLKIEKAVFPSPSQMQMVVEGMRNPMNSWDKSDSFITHIEDAEDISMETADYQFNLGEADEKLMLSLAKGGGPHSKYRRMMPVMVTITAPLYWWKEFDTYQTGVAPNPTDIVKNSCSTMHKIHAKEFDISDFSCEHLYGYDWLFELDGSDEELVNDHLAIFPTGDSGEMMAGPLDILEMTIKMLNAMRAKFLETGDKMFWWQMIQLLPSSYNQKRTVALNYEVLSRIYTDRREHKLDEWHTFCDWIERIPYSGIALGN